MWWEGDLGLTLRGRVSAAAALVFFGVLDLLFGRLGDTCRGS